MASIIEEVGGTITALARGFSVTFRNLWRKSTTENYPDRSEEHTSELQSQSNLVCRLLLEKKKKRHQDSTHPQTQTIPSILPYIQNACIARCTPVPRTDHARHAVAHSSDTAPAPPSFYSSS